jgi:hypothetical protein
MSLTILNPNRIAIRHEREKYQGSWSKLLDKDSTSAH